MELQEAVIVSGARTAVGRFGGAFKDVAAPDLGAEAIKAALERAGIRPEQVEEVVMGNALQATEAGYAARLSSLKAGIPQETPTIAINRQCSSGLEAINMAAQLVRTGEVDIAVAGGMENMSQTPYLLGYQARFDGLRMGDATMRDGLTEGLGCPVNRYHMGVTAENVAERFEVSREDQDELALISHQRAVAAIAGGRFSEQIVDVSVPQRRGDPVVVSQDEGPRADTTLERLASLRPYSSETGALPQATHPASMTALPQWSSCPRRRQPSLAFSPNYAGIRAVSQESSPPSWAQDRSLPCARRSASPA